MKKRLALCFVLLCVVALTACLLVACGDGGKSSSDSGYNGGGSSGGSGYNSTTMVDLIRSKGRYVSNGDYQYSIGTQDYYGYDFDIYLQCSSDMDDVFIINATYGSIELTAFVYLNPQKVQVWTKRGSDTKFAAEINSYSRATSDYLDYWTINIYNLTTASEDLQLAEYAMYCFPVYEWLFYTTNSVLTMRNFSVTLYSMGFSLKSGSSQGGGSQGGGSHTTCSHHTGTWTCSTCGADLFSLLDSTIKQNATESSGGKYTVNYEVDSSTLLSGITDGSTVKLECLYYSDGKGWLTVLSISKNRELGWSLSSAETKTVVIGTITSPGSLTTDNFGNCISISTTYYGTSNSSFVAAMLLVSINELFQYMNNLAFPEYLPSVSLANFGLSYFDGTEIYRFAFVSMTTEVNNITIRYAKKGAPMPYVAPETRPGYKWLGWYDENDVNYDEYTTATSDMTFTPKWQIESYDVTLDANGGTVSQNSTAVEYNSKPTFPVPTRTGYTFDGWYDGTYSSAKQYTGSNGKMQNAWTETSGKTLYAHWTPISYMMTTQQNLYAAGSVTSSAFVDFDSEQTIVATTNIGYTWLGWYEDGELLTEDTSYTFKVEGDRSFTAKWKVCPITIEKNKAEAGSVSGFDGRTIGANETVTATTNSGYTWVGWYEGDNLLTTSMTYLFVLRDEEKTITAKWSKVDVAKNKAEAGSVTTLNGRYHFAENVTIEATTNAGYVWIGWYEGDTLLTGDAEYAFAMSEIDRTFTAKWAKIDIEMNKAEAGTVSALEDAYIVGDTATVTAETNAGYTWLGWYDGDVLLTDETEYEIEMIAEDKVYTAKWSQSSVEKNIAGAGTISALSDSYVVGDTVIVAAETNLGYTWLGWYDGDVLLTAETEYEIEMTAEDKVFTAKWEDNAEMGNFVFSSNQTTCTITGIINKTETEIVVPNYVTNISGGAFSGCSVLESITIPFVGGSASATSASASTLFGYIFGTSSYTGGTSKKQYYSSGSSTTYYIPSTLRNVTVTGGNILRGAFYNCSMLTSITIPDSVTIIYGYAFSRCSGLTSITIPDSVTNIGGYAFDGCSGLTSITIPDSVTSIGESVFIGCSGLTSITIPDSVIRISRGAFNSCTGLTSITIPESVTQIDGYAFRYCSGLTSITIPDSVTSIGEYAFYYCDGLTSVTIGSSVTSIGECAFSNCSGLTSLIIPANVNSIGLGAFSGCSRLQSITIPFVGGQKTNSYVREVSLFGYIFGKNSYDGGEATKQWDDGYFVTYYVPISLKNVTVTGKTTLKGAFSHCSNLESITILYDVVSIDDYAFAHCSKLKEFTIPNSVTSINTGAFQYCSSLTSITIPDGVTQIGGTAFWECRGLTNMTIPNSVKSFGMQAFEHCGFKRVDFEGTKSQWNAISKYTDWSRYTHYYVYCTDGTIEINY